MHEAIGNLGNNQRVLANMRDVTLQRLLTSPFRVLPDFIILGTMKGGTTSLYRALMDYPCVAPALKKEVNFFAGKCGRNIWWYRAHFPTYLRRFAVCHQSHQILMTGEATPSYMFDPHAPRRIWETLPKAKLLMMLRNPVDRALSHYHHVVRKGKEPLSFEAAVEEEPVRLEGELERMLEDEHYRSFPLGQWSYLSRGIYIDQLLRLETYFSPEQILVIQSEEFFNRPYVVMKRVAGFLGLPAWQPRRLPRENTGDYPPMNPATRKRLVAYFAPHNQRLYEHLGIDFGWDR